MAAHRNQAKEPRGGLFGHESIDTCFVPIEEMMKQPVGINELA
jgi:hypothetical protein